MNSERNKLAERKYVKSKKENLLVCGLAIQSIRKTPPWSPPFLSLNPAHYDIQFILYSRFILKHFIVESLKLGFTFLNYVN